MAIGKGRSAWFSLLVSCTPLFFPAASLAVEGDFDAGLEGWTAEGGTLIHVAAGGNPDGFLQLTDETNSNMFLTAPQNAFYSGNLSGYVNGFVQFDARLVGLSGPATPFTTFGTIRFSNGANSASFDLAPLGEPTDQWTTYMARLTSPPWGSDSSNWLDILSNVTSLTVNLESHSPIVETVGFDNFRLSALPEPGTLALATCTLGAAAFARSGLRRQVGSSK